MIEKRRGRNQSPLFIDDKMAPANAGNKPEIAGLELLDTSQRIYVEAPSTKKMLSIIVTVCLVFIFPSP